MGSIWLKGPLRCVPTHPRNGIVLKKKKKATKKKVGTNRICLDLEYLLCAGSSAKCWWGSIEENRQSLLFKSSHGGDKFKI